MMPKGKKFSAAEKHFEEKKVRLEKEIKTLKASVTAQRDTIQDQAQQIARLTEENQQLQMQVERLLQYTKLSQEDIRLACEKDKQTAKAMTTIDGLFKLSGMFSDF